MQEQRIAEALASVSRDRDTRLLAKNWDKVQGMDEIKHELLRQARAVAQVWSIGRSEIDGKKLPDGMYEGGWIAHSAGGWYGKILNIRLAATGLMATIGWYGNPERKGNEGRYSVSAEVSMATLKAHTPLTEEPKLKK